MATVNFLYRSTRDKANLSLRLLFTFNGKDFVFGESTKFEVSKEYWKKQHKKKSKDIDVINEQTRVNNELNSITNHVLSAFKSVNPHEVDKKWLQTQLEYYYNPPQKAERLPTELIKYLDKYIESKRNDIAHGTLKKCNVFKQLLLRYQTHCCKTIFLTDVDSGFKTHFENYCTSNGYAPNTIARALRFIKTLCKHAKAHGLEVSYQLDNIKVKYQKVDSIYLTDEELVKLEKINKKKLTESLENARDWLLISCHTGQRVSDFMRFTKSMIRYERNKEGILKPLIEFTQRKTNKLMTIPLSQEVMAILERRNGEFPQVISDQKYNDYIKTVCEKAKINQLVKGSRMAETEANSGIFRKETGVYKKYELVTSHIGRRSFATNKYGKIPTSFLIYMTGHSTEAMFLNYIGKSNKDIAMELTSYF